MHQKYHYLTRSNSSQSLKHTMDIFRCLRYEYARHKKKQWTEDQRLISPYHLSRAAIKQPFCCVVIQQIFFVREVAKLVGLDRDETARGHYPDFYMAVFSHSQSRCQSGNGLLI